MLFIMPYKILKLGHVSLLGPIFHLCKVLGLLPVDYNVKSCTSLACCWKHHDFAKKEKPFSKSVSGIVISTFHLCLQLCIVYKVIRFCIEVAIKHNVTCMKGNHCATFGIMISHALVSFSSVATAIFFRNQKTINCLNSLYRMLDHKNPVYPRLPFASFAIYGFLLILIFRMIINEIFYSPSDSGIYYFYLYSYCVPIVVQNFVAVLVLAGEHSFRQINQGLKELLNFRHDPESFSLKIKQLAEEHIMVTDYVENISSCFGLDLLLGTIDNFFQLVLFLYTLLWTLLVEKIYLLQGSWPPFVIGVCEIFTIVSKTFYLCYRCSAVTKEGQLTLWYLHRITTLPYLDDELRQKVTVFIMQHNSRCIEVKPLGLFTFNMTLLLKVVGIVSSYFIVLIQFQLSNRAKGHVIKNITRKTCKVWPCIE